jgi:putative aminopeptidase FrvX
MSLALRPSIVLTIPTRHIHSHVAMLSLDDMENAVTFLVEAVKRPDEKTVDSFTTI